MLPPEEAPPAKEAVQARVEAPPQQGKASTQSEQDELAAALEEMENEQVAEQKKKAGR